MSHVSLPTNPRERKRTDLIKRLGSSKFNYWFGYVANISIVIWLVGHALPHGRALLGPVELLEHRPRETQIGVAPLVAGPAGAVGATS